MTDQPDPDYPTTIAAIYPSLERAPSAASATCPGTGPSNQASRVDHYTDNGNIHLIAAIADGQPPNADSGILAQAAVQIAISQGVTVDHRTHPERLIALTRAVLPEIGDFTDTNPHVFYDFTDYYIPDRADTTLLIATADNTGALHISSVGDTRAAVLTADGKFRTLTTDDTYDDEDGHTFLTRSLGFGPPGHVWWSSSRTGNRACRVLLSTSGLHGPLTEAEISGILSTVTDPAQAASDLVRQAAQADGTFADNVTALVIDIPPPDTP
ncbi:protein phosphatase 2C domain-containing protein [Nocardia brasiliensis]|uniref:protein phosphatase 2C domain-containing protein n=1 Tax=Nocardia brasiliensis TaxID=37326 RepID=UPI002455A98E|nr:protein phosphatase 2C domain-containing protein [Nocardia brasiliensis]